MYLPKTEISIIRSLRQKLNAYKELFGKHFPAFNHDEWFDLNGQDAIDVYQETLTNCIKTKTPYRNPYE